jgi:hypothetical protein
MEESGKALARPFFAARKLTSQQIRYAFNSVFNWEFHPVARTSAEISRGERYD